MPHTHESDSHPVKIKQRTLREMNEGNRKFWEEQSSLAVTRIANPVIFKKAMQDLESEQLRRIPVYFRKSMEKALEDAARTKQWFDEQSKGQFQIEFSRKGGKAPKPDALTQFIMSNVRNNHDLTEPELLELLKENRRIFRVNEEEIYFDKRNGAQKSVPLSALKDRLYRVRRKSIRANRLSQIQQLA